MNFWRNPLSGALTSPKLTTSMNSQPGTVLQTLDRAALALMLLVLSVPAFAFAPPAAGDLAFELYDVVVNQGIEGPIGAMIAVASVIFGIFGIANRNWWAMGGGFAGTTAMVVGDDIVTSVGFLI